MFQLKDKGEKPMSVVEDVRKVLQDFLAPELRELKVRIEAVEKRIDERHAEVMKRMDERHEDVLHRMDERHGDVSRQFDLTAQQFVSMEKRMDARHAEVMKRMEDGRAEMLEAMRVSDQRMDRRVDSILNFAELKEKVAVLDAERQAKQRAAS